MLRYHDHGTPLNWTMTAWSSWATSTTKQNWFYHFFERDLISENSISVRTFNSTHVYWNTVAMSCFSSWKAFVKCPSVCKRHFWWRQIWRHLHVRTLQCWAKFSNVLVHWSIWMIRAKNDKTKTKFVKVMPRILWPLFFPDTVYIGRIARSSLQ